MSVNKNNISSTDQVVSSGSAGEGSPGAVVNYAVEVGEFLVVLDDLAPQTVPQDALGVSDQRLLQALQSILEKRQTDAWVDKMKAEISSELEWQEAEQAT